MDLSAHITESEEDAVFHNSHEFAMNYQISCVENSCYLSTFSLTKLCMIPGYYFQYINHPETLCPALKPLLEAKGISV